MPSWIWGLGPFVVGLPILGWFVLRRGKAGDPVPRGAPPLVGRGLLATALLYGTYLFVAVAVGIVAVAMDPGIVKDKQALLLIDGGPKILALAVTGIALHFIGGVRDPGPAPARPAVIAGLAAAVAFIPLMVATAWMQAWVWKAMGWKMESQDLVAFAIDGSDRDFAFVLFFAVVLAPVFEEMVFRVHFYSGLRRWMGPAGAAVLSAAIFSLSHLQPVTFPVLFALGLCLAYLRERTGGRSAPMAMHACYNAVQMAGILAFRVGGGPPTGG